MQQTEISLLAKQDVQIALAEDLGPGDLLQDLATDKQISARLVSRETGILAGSLWAQYALQATCVGDFELTWAVEEGQEFSKDAEIFNFSGPATGLLTAERVILNYLQLMCAVATVAKRLSEAAKPVPVYTTRKTLPKLRGAQKYAASVGGMQINRTNLHEAIIIKENHIAVAGSIAKAFAYAQKKADLDNIQIEVTNLDELQQALDVGAHRIMLDNFAPKQVAKAVNKVDTNKIELEASGNITIDNVADYARTGIARISSSVVTKSVQAIDLSLLIE